MTKKYYCFDCKHEHGTFENHIWDEEKKEDEKIIDLSPKVGKKMIPKGFMAFKMGTKLSKGDRIVADLGGIEYASGYVENPDESSVFGETGVSFWSFSGWKHLEFAKYKEILAYKRRNLK